MKNDNGNTSQTPDTETVSGRVHRLVRLDEMKAKTLPIREMHLGMRVRAWATVDAPSDGVICCLSIEGEFEEVTIKFDDYEKPIGPFKPQRVEILPNVEDNRRV